MLQHVCIWIHLKVCQISTIRTGLKPMFFFSLAIICPNYQREQKKPCKNLLLQQREGDILVDVSHFPSKWNPSVVSRDRDIELYLEAVNV